MLRLLKRSQTHGVDNNSQVYWTLRIRKDFGEKGLQLLNRYRQLPETIENNDSISFFTPESSKIDVKLFYQFLWIHPRIKEILILNERYEFFFTHYTNITPYPPEVLEFISKTLEDFRIFLNENDESENEDENKNFITIDVQKFHDLTSIKMQYDKIVNILAANKISSSEGCVFHRATYLNLPSLVSDLLCANVDPNCLNKAKETALCDLLSRVPSFYIRREKIINLLLDAGADPRILDQNKKNVLHYIADSAELASNLEKSAFEAYTRIKDKILAVSIAKDKEDLLGVQLPDISALNINYHPDDEEKFTEPLTLKM